jgi:hypothetical protein
MAQTVHKSMRELFEGWDPSKDNLQDCYETFRTATEELAGSWLPGDGNPEDHPYDAIFEDVMPSHGVIEGRLERAREAHRKADANPNEGAHQAGRGYDGPVDDLGGQNVPYSGSDKLYQLEESAGLRVRQSNGRDVSKAPLTRGFPVVRGD